MTRSMEQLSIHERALQRAAQRNGNSDPRIDARFEEARRVAGGDSGLSPMRDASLNWASGEQVAPLVVGDQPLSSDLANVAGVVAASGVERPATKGGGAKSGVTAIINHADGRE